MLNQTSAYEIETEDFNILNEIHKFVKQIISIKKEGFLIVKSAYEGTFGQNELSRHFNKMHDYFNQLKPGYVYDEYIELFRDACNSLNNWRINRNADPTCFQPEHQMTGAEMHNYFADYIHTQSQSKEFKRKGYERQRNSVRNYQRCVQYIDALFKQYSRLLVLRLDLAYPRGAGISFDQAHADLEHFLANKRGNSLFNTRVGYVIKLEYSVVKGHHFHCIFFLNGSESRKDKYLALEYGKYWKSVTKSKSIFHSCNDKSYIYPGTGMVHHSDMEKRKNLLKPLYYFMKVEQHVHVKPTAKSRTLWCGNMPEERTSNVGRPRMIQNRDIAMSGMSKIC